MDEQKKDGNTYESEIIITAEKYIFGIINFIIVYPKTLFLTIWKPAFFKDGNAVIKPLTYFTISLLASSRFWYYLWEPTTGFISPIVDYVLNPKLDRTLSLAFNSSELFKTIFSLLPAVGITLVSVSVISMIFSINRDQREHLRSAVLYSAGTALIIYPLLFVMLLFSLDSPLESFLFSVIYLVAGVVLFLQLRFIWKSISQLLSGSKLMAKKLVLMVLILGMIFFNARSPSLFYVDEYSVKSQLIGDIGIDVSDSTEYELSVEMNILLSNYSAKAEVIDLFDSKCTLYTKERHFESWLSEENVIKSSSELNDLTVLDGYSSILVTARFLFYEDSIKYHVYQDLKNQYSPDSTFQYGSIDLELELGEGFNIQSSERSTFDRDHIHSEDYIPYD